MWSLCSCIIPTLPLFFILLDMRLQYSKGDTGLPGYNLPYQMMGTRIVGVWFHCDSSVSKDDERCWHTDPSFRTVDRILYYTYYSYAPIWSLTSSTCVRPCSFLSASKPQRLTSESLISILRYISIVSYYLQFQNYPLMVIILLNKLWCLNWIMSTTTIPIHSIHVSSTTKLQLSFLN